jgi:hypothetical protein
MPITEIPTHTLDQFRHQVRCCEDCFYRIRSYLEPVTWEEGDFYYVLEQLEKAKQYLFAAQAVALAQRASVELLELFESRRKED